MNGRAKENTETSALVSLICNSAEYVDLVDGIVSIEAGEKGGNAMPETTEKRQFFDRPDAEKQFIYQKLLECPDPEAALANYRKILEK